MDGYGGELQEKVSVGFTNDPMPMEFLFVIHDKSERSKLIKQHPFFDSSHSEQSQRQVCQFRLVI